MTQAVINTLNQLGNGLGLVPGRLVIGMELEEAFGHGVFLMATLPSQEGSKIMV